jgi:hypothetical protein
MDRRSFVRFTGAATLGFATASCRAGAGYDERSLARPELLSVLGDGPVRAIGTHYRALATTERDVAALRDAIVASRPLSARLFGASAPTIPELIRDDFAHRRTIVVDGWILALTEARQCALYSLLTA